jgi:hypothetical protein
MDIKTFRKIAMLPKISKNMKYKFNAVDDLCVDKVNFNNLTESILEQILLCINENDGLGK